jgi:2-desacetyl-2-hydroxyethyl bacteriochlorophyllide A dehydrogenase
VRTAVIVEPQHLDVQTVRLPDPSDQQVRVRLEGTGVCGSNLPVWQGRPWFAYPLDPGAPGHEGWGVIDAVGASVDHLAPGQRVAMLSSHAFAEYDIADADAVVPVPAEVSSAAFPGEPLACAANVFQRSGIKRGDRVAIVGIGFLGAIITALASDAGAEVVALSRRAFARDIATQMGASLTVPFESVDQARSDLGRQGHTEFDCVIEAIGSQSALDLAAELPRVRGRLVIAGYHQDGSRHVNMQSWNWRGLDVINAHERDTHVYVGGMRMALDYMRRGILDPTPLFTHRVPLVEMRTAFELLQSRPDGFMKALVMM